MNKSILILSSSLMALSAMAVAPQEWPGLQVTAISTDGNYVIAKDESQSLVIINTALNSVKAFEITDEFQPNPGVGRAVSNTGVVACSTTPGGDDASYYENGEFHMLPLKETDKNASFAQGISSNGNHICGCVGVAPMSMESSSIMQVPALWSRNEKGEFEVYESLPYPEKDFSNRVPQYVFALAVSDDGCTVIGQVIDYTGMCPQPIVYKKDADGKWSYTVLMQEVFTPEGEIPEYPGECKSSPNAQDYLTEEELAAYNAAYAAYYEYMDSKPVIDDFMSDVNLEAYAQAYQEWINADPDTRGPMPTKKDFLTEENKAKYEQALADYVANQPSYPNISDFVVANKEKFDADKEEYEAYYAEWSEKNIIFEDFFWPFAETLPNFEFNASALSTNGRYMAQISSVGGMWEPTVTTSYVFDLNDGSYKVFDQSAGAITSISDSGMLLSTVNSGDFSTSQAYIAESFDSEFIPLQDYVASKNPDLAAWMKEHMAHTYTTTEYVEDENGNWEVKDVTYTDKFHTGIPYASADFSVFTSWAANIWDYDGAYTYAYLMPMDYTAGIESAIVGAADIRIIPGKNGEFTVSGNCTGVEIFDLNGRRVFSGSNGGTINTGTPRGIYIIKATDANGNSKIAKTSF